MNKGEHMEKSGKTVFITGTSSGIGLLSALEFYEKGWNGIATMRYPETRNTLLHEKGLPDLVHLDVTDEPSIQAAIQYTLEKYKTIDVLVNNAGYAAYGPFEATTPAQIKKEYDTNVLGLMAVTRAFLPVFRKQNGGTIVNVASMGGRLGFPLYSIYNSTKFAVEGFSESLRYELAPLNINVRLIEPGVIKTDFYDRSLDRGDTSGLGGAYDDFIRRAKKSMSDTFIQQGSEPEVVAREIYRAATDSGSRLRYPVGTDAKAVRVARWLLPDGLLFRLIEKNTLD
jgi:NAD(P)-dependent dehydrogenase (short-subunit alcohol dehydrogenase family)